MLNAIQLYIFLPRLTLGRLSEVANVADAPKATVAVYKVIVNVKVESGNK